MSQSNSTSSGTKENSAENSKTSTNCEEESPTIDPTEKWLIRDCDLYKDEYNECTSIKARFHQYFIYGQYLDCNQWNKDYLNCCKWVDNNDTKAADALIRSEKNRRLDRLRSHYQNDVWKKRDSPPDDWAQPLPEWMAKRDENTYLAHKAKEMNEGKVEENNSLCVIM